MNRTILTLTFLAGGSILYAQKNSEAFRNEIYQVSTLANTDIKDEFIKYDLSPTFTQTTNYRVLGFIGDDYQRIRIKLISVIKNKADPGQYFVYGKSMVKENVCEFQGTIIITNVFYLKTTDVPDVKQGKAVGEYLFYEDPLQKHVGQFKGVFSTNWYIDKEGNMKYDDLSDVADGFTNNEFVGTWTNYSRTITKACNWGDNRIPMSGDLDQGAGEFHPADKYLLNLSSGVWWWKCY